jgi:hypothetical protein
MTHRVIWREFNYLGLWGEPGVCAPPYLPKDSHVLLLYQVQMMPKKIPISMEKAMLLVSKRHSELYRETPDLKKIFWFYEEWVRWVSEQGFHIELSAEDFEILEGA